MKRVFCSLLIGISLFTVGCGSDEIRSQVSGQVEESVNSETVEEEIITNEETKEEDNKTTLNEYMHLRLYLETGDGTNEIDYNEAILLNCYCRNNEELKIFEECLEEESIYSLYPDLNCNE